MTLLSGLWHPADSPFNGDEDLLVSFVTFDLDVFDGLHTAKEGGVSEREVALERDVPSSPHTAGEGHPRRVQGIGPIGK